MSTGRDLIYAALREIGAFGSEETPQAEGTNDALKTLNRMWGGWNADLGNIYSETLDSLTLVPSTASYTIGPDFGVFNVTRPVQILAAQLRYATNTDLPIEIISFDKYQEVSNKTSSADVVQYLAYNATYPNGVIYVWPVPTVAYVIRLTSKKILSDFDLDTTLSLPPGYEDAIVLNLAVRLSQGWGRPVSQMLYSSALEAKSIITRANTVIEEMETDPALPGQGRKGRFNWKIG
jgi:hypothetical protein